MYTTVRGIPTGDVRAGRGPAARRVSGLVVTLGTVSFFTDLSSEMVVAVLPVYLTLVLQLSPVQYGLIDGLYTGVTAAVRIVGGLVADLTGRPKLVAVAGYGLSCVCKLFFLPATTFTALMGLVAVDRTGKGLRTAPRDAMIVGASEPDSLGYSFGVHRAMDTAGALGGPLIAFGLLALLPGGWDVLFVLSFGLAAVGVAILVLFVPGRVRATAAARSTSPAAPQAPAVRVRRGAVRRTLGELRGLVRTSAYRRLLAVGGLLSLATVSDGFIYLTLKDRADISATVFPLLFVGTAAGYLVLAVPFGRLADRVGRRRVFLGGHVLAAVAYLLMWVLPPAPWLIVPVLLLVGSYYAATDGVLPALAAPIVPERLRTSGIAGVQTMMAVGGMCSTGLFGWAWSLWGQQAAIAAFSFGLAGAIGLSAVLLARRVPAG